MSLFAMPLADQAFNEQLASVLHWAKNHQVEAEQLMLDAVHMLACPFDSQSELCSQGFFQRCWNRFASTPEDIEQLHSTDIRILQKLAFKYLYYRLEQESIAPHVLFSLRNNLFSVAVQESVTMPMVAKLSQHLAKSFTRLDLEFEHTLHQESSASQQWLYSLEQTAVSTLPPHQRLLHIINDFALQTQRAWTYNDLMNLRKALLKEELRPQKKISLQAFTQELITELSQDNFAGMAAYREALAQFAFQGQNKEEHFAFVLEQLSSPIMCILYAIALCYEEVMLVTSVRERVRTSPVTPKNMRAAILAEPFNAQETLEVMVYAQLYHLGVDIHAQLPLADLAIELVGNMALIKSMLSQDNGHAVTAQANDLALADAICQYDLGCMYLTGQGLPPDYTLAAASFQEAAAQGMKEAQFNLGNMYFKGMGVEQDYNQAALWLKKAAEQGHGEAQFNLGLIYAKGYLGHPEYRQAALWYRKAAIQGIAPAQFNLARFFFVGQGVGQNPVLAALWYRKAANQNFVEAQYNLALMYKDGLGIPQQDLLAAAWQRKAASLGLPDAQCHLALLYTEGRGVPLNYKQAVYWYNQAAEAGYAQAQYNLGLLYFQGEGVPQDFVQAAELFSKAAHQGLAQAQYSLAYGYFYGKGIEQDYAKAVEWYQKAAEQGYAKAQYVLGVMYYKGHGIGKNPLRAMEWFRKAAAQGYKVEYQQQLCK